MRQCTRILLGRFPENNYSPPRTQSCAIRLRALNTRAHQSSQMVSRANSKSPGRVTMLQTLPHVLDFKCVPSFGEAQVRRQCCTSVRSQDRLRSRLISAARLGRSFSLTASNFNPSPPPGFTCRTIALARICPSWTRKWRLAFAPRRFVLRVSMNNPPALRFFTRDRSQSPVHSQ